VPTSLPPRLPSASIAESLDRVRGLLHRTLESAADRFILVALRVGSPRAVVLPEREYEAFIATIEVDEDPEALDDLQAGLEETHLDLPPTWEELEGELGPLGKSQTHKAV
jgi:PHD/YefM family antitoxin component YafN of YafNO toxin-antitoxin module